MANYIFQRQRSGQPVTLRTGYIPPNTPEATNLPAAPDTSYTPLDNTLAVMQIQNPTGAGTIFTPSQTPGATEALLAMYGAGQQQQPSYAPPTFASQGSGSYYGGGGGGGMNTEQAQVILNEYVALLQGGDPLNAGLQTALSDWQQQAMQGLRRGRRQDLEALLRLRQRGQRQIRRQVRGARRTARNAYQDLNQYIRDNNSVAFDGLEARGARDGGRSGALLADQGAGTAAVDAAARRADTMEGRSGNAYNQLASMLGANAREANRDFMDAARAGYGDARNAIAGQRMDAVNQLINDYVTARMGVNQQFRQNQQNLTNQFGQQNFALQQQGVQQQQAIRDAIMQLALQYGLDLPPYLFAMGAQQ